MKIHRRDKINNFNGNNSELINSSMLIMDTTADQYTCGGNAWIVTNVTGEEIRCNGYIRNNKEPQGHILPVVLAITCVQTKDSEPFILLVNQACYHDDEQ